MVPCFLLASLVFPALFSLRRTFHSSFRSMTTSPSERLHRWSSKGSLRRKSKLNLGCSAMKPRFCAGASWIGMHIPLKLEPIGWYVSLRSYSAVSQIGSWHSESISENGLCWLHYLQEFAPKVDEFFCVVSKDGEVLSRITEISRKLALQVLFCATLIVSRGFVREVV
jgi:hypothetical protein